MDNAIKNSKNTWNNYVRKAFRIQRLFDFSNTELLANQNLINKNRGELEIKSIKWFLPSFKNIYGGGIYTIFRFASYLYINYGVLSTFYIYNNPAPDIDNIKKLITRSFPSLDDATVLSIDQVETAGLLPYSDASICTFWSTAYLLLRDNNTKRKFYFIQDYEPLFYPAGSTSGLVEATYNFGFYGITNTIALKNIYEHYYNGVAEYFEPNVDGLIFHPPEKQVIRDDNVYQIFFYGRPDNPRNGFELGISALKKLKLQRKDNIKIITAGQEWSQNKYGLSGIVNNKGIISVEETAEIYRNSCLGLSLMFTPHPSYIPLELMASKCAVVTNLNPANEWLLRSGKTCFSSQPTVSCLAEILSQVLDNNIQRERVVDRAYKFINKKYSNWDRQIEKIYQYMCLQY